MIALVVGIAACDSESNGLLNNVPLNPFPVNPSPFSSSSVSGQWFYNRTDLVGSGLACTISSFTMLLTPSGATFTGTTSSVATVTCSGEGRTFTQSAASGQNIPNGVVSGDSVHFDIVNQNFHNAGILLGNSTMSGTVTLRVPVGGSTFLVSGPFTAVRQ